MSFKTDFKNKHLWDKREDSCNAWVNSNSNLSDIDAYSRDGKYSISCIVKIDNNTYTIRMNDINFIPNTTKITRRSVYKIDCNRTCGHNRRTKACNTCDKITCIKPGGCLTFEIDRYEITVAYEHINIRVK